MGNTEEILLSESEVAQILKISTRTLQGWRLVGRGPDFVKFPRHVRYKQSDIEKYLSENTCSSTSALHAKSF
jgi:predicted DNA-binding transcriptional regulator AlpA